jgi:hypothetical protein
VSSLNNAHRHTDHRKLNHICLNRNGENQELGCKASQEWNSSERERSKQPDQTDKRDLSPETRESLERSEPVMVSNTYGHELDSSSYPTYQEEKQVALMSQYAKAGYSNSL